MNNPQISRFAVAVPLENDGTSFVGILQTMTRAFVLMPAEDWNSLLHGPARPTDQAVLEQFHEQNVLVRKETDETAVFENWKQQYVYDGSTIKSKVLVTRRCNNACRYCLIDPEAKSMSRETALVMDRFYIALLKEKHPTRVSDEYSGGEVLLNPKVVLDSASRRFHFCQGRGIEYGFSIITNGTRINPSIIERMREAGLKGIRVSIAGPAAVHDKLRPSEQGGKTYNLIMENLHSISGLISITVECQYDSGSRDYLMIPEMMDDLDRLGIAVETIHFAPILPTRNKSPHQPGIGDPNIFLYLEREAQRRGYPQFSEPPSNTCAVDFRHQYIFDTDGSIIPCPALQGGEMSYGSVFKGIDFAAESQLLRRNLPERCLSECELLPLCMGGCRQQALVNGSGFQGIDCRYETLRLVLEEYIVQKAKAALGSSGGNGSRRAE